MEVQAEGLAINLCRLASACGAHDPHLPLVFQLDYYQLAVAELILHSFVHLFIATHLRTYSMSDCIYLEEQMQPQP